MHPDMFRDQTASVNEWLSQPGLAVLQSKAPAQRKVCRHADVYALQMIYSCRIVLARLK